MDLRAQSNRNLQFRPPENLRLAHKPDFDFLHEFSGRFSTQKGLGTSNKNNERFSDTGRLSPHQRHRYR
jgi:hypothetical protein